MSSSFASIVLLIPRFWNDLITISLLIFPCEFFIHMYTWEASAFPLIQSGIIAKSSCFIKLFYSFLNWRVCKQKHWSVEVYLLNCQLCVCFFIFTYGLCISYIYIYIHYLFIRCLGRKEISTSNFGVKRTSSRKNRIISHSQYKFLFISYIQRWGRQPNSRRIRYSLLLYSDLN